MQEPRTLGSQPMAGCHNPHSQVQQLTSTLMTFHTWYNRSLPLAKPAGVQHDVCLVTPLMQHSSNTIPRGKAHQACHLRLNLLFVGPQQGPRCTASRLAARAVQQLQSVHGNAYLVPTKESVGHPFSAPKPMRQHGKVTVHTKTTTLTNGTQKSCTVCQGQDYRPPEVLPRLYTPLPHLPNCISTVISHLPAHPTRLIERRTYQEFHPPEAAADKATRGYTGIGASPSQR